MDPFVYVLTGALALAVVAVVYLLVKLRHAARDRREMHRRFSNLEDQLDASALKNVEARLNPHLFKNILNSIQSHAYQTYFALDKLANVLDYILYDSRDKFVTPKDEIAFALNLIEINKIKISPLFEFKVKQKIDDDEPLYHQKVMAPLISVDLIENAFKHADLQSSDAFISITFEFADGVFGLTVSNKVSPREPLQKERGGIGAETLEHRLKIIYKDHFRLERFSQGDTYIASLTIDLREHQAQMRTA